MGKIYDEPVFIDVKIAEDSGTNEQNLPDRIRKLCRDQSFAVLASQGKDGPDASLISFATSPDLKFLVFSTPRNTTKFSNIAVEENVSLLADNRSDRPDSINQIIALTITGRAMIISEEQRIAEWSDLLTERHPYLEKFVNSASSAIILVEVSRYLLVSNFQELSEWDPR